MDGTVSWRAGRPGCASMTTTGGQQLQLTGPLAEQYEHRAATGAETVTERALITGYVPPIGASVCGSAFPFVVEKVDVVHDK